MKVVEVRRHSKRGSGDDLSEEGVELARRAKRTLEGPYFLCYSSPKWRCVRTLQELGCHEYRIDERFGPLPSERVSVHDGRVRETMNRHGVGLLEAYFEVDEVRGILKEKGAEVLQAVRDAAKTLPQGRQALAVSHGGTIEPAAIFALGRGFSLSALGGALRECEGVRFLVEDREIRRVDIIRLTS